MKYLNISSREVGKLLDYGSGGGEFLELMHRNGWDVVGYEPDKIAAKAVYKKYGIEVMSNLDEVGKLESIFNVITLSHVIEHVESPEKLLGFLKGKLTKGGKIIITTPNAEGLYARVFGKYWRGLEAPRHIHIFTMKSLVDLLIKLGYKIDERKTISRMSYSIFVKSLLASFGKKNIENIYTKFTFTQKIIGYLFLSLEYILNLYILTIGEELYIRASKNEDE